MNVKVIDLKTGQLKTMGKRYAEILVKMRRAKWPDAEPGQYQTKVLVAAPASQPVMGATTGVEAKVDLDKLSKEELHDLAKALGVKVHHAAGAEKVREALRGTAE